MNLPAVEVERDEKRRFERLEVELPCTIDWGRHRVQGKIVNISEGGAWITQVQSAPPPEGAMVTLQFQLQGTPVSVVSSVTSRVIRTLMEIVEDGNIGALAVQFEDESREAQLELQSVLQALEGAAGA